MRDQRRRSEIVQNFVESGADSDDFVVEYADEWEWEGLSLSS